MKKALFIGIGIGLFIIGFIGLALPILPGFILLFIGFTFLNKELSWLEKLNLRKDKLINKLKKFYI
ncbi:MAG: PGPGW domain-containing protein [bacterium]|nr:PGPGW domain-containing protein [bacterium]